MDMNTLVSVINTLNGIEVKGKTNMNKLLGCILTLEQLVGNAQKEQSDEPEEQNG